MFKHTLSIALLFLILVAGCARQEPVDTAVTLATERAQIASRGLMTDLMAALQDALAEGPPEHAISLCSELAQRISSSDAERDGLRMRRTALRVRNPANAPDEHERAVLERWLVAAKLPPFETEVLPLDNGWRELRYMQPIVLKPFCVTCHGSDDELAETLRAVLDEHYPDDQARGFKPGELRGAVSVRVSLPPAP